MNAAAILLAAGRGERLGGERPKAFVELEGESLLARVVRTVDGCPGIRGFVVAVRPGLEDEGKAIAARSPKLLAVVPGGETRQASVRLGLEALPASHDVVVCHDVARALASPRLFAAVLAGLEGADGAVPALAIPDTLKQVEGGTVSRTVPRDGLVAAQTPQAFRRDRLERAHRLAEAQGFDGTDDAALVERAGGRVVAVPGEPANLKVTTPEDLALARALLDRG